MAYANDNEVLGALLANLGATPGVSNGGGGAGGVTEEDFGGAFGENNGESAFVDENGDFGGGFDEYGAEIGENGDNVDENCNGIVMNAGANGGAAPAGFESGNRSAYK